MSKFLVCENNNSNCCSRMLINSLPGQALKCGNPKIIIFWYFGIWPEPNWKHAPMLISKIPCRIWIRHDGDWKYFWTNWNATPRTDSGGGKGGGGQASLVLMIAFLNKKLWLHFWPKNFFFWNLPHFNARPGRGARFQHDAKTMHATYILLKLLNWQFAANWLLSWFCCVYVF